MTRLLLITSVGLTVPAEVTASVAVPLVAAKSSGLPEIEYVGVEPLPGPVPVNVRPLNVNVPVSLLEMTVPPAA